MTALELQLVELGRELDVPEAPDLAPAVIAQIAPRSRRTGRRRWLLAVALLVVAAIGATLAIPSARSAFLRVFHIGGEEIRVVDKLPAIKPELNLDVALGSRITLVEAQRRFPTRLRRLDEKPDAVFYARETGTVWFLYGSVEQWLSAYERSLAEGTKMAVKPATPAAPRPVPVVPRGVLAGSYRCSIPLIRPSLLTTKSRGGVGKNLSEGWNLNFAVGCTHACPFCYVDPIHKRFGAKRYGEAVRQTWGDYLLVPENLDEAIERTKWSRWDGLEVMISSTHDPYLPNVATPANAPAR